MASIPRTLPSMTCISGITVRSLITALAFASAGAVHAQVSEQACGSLAATYGPFDYRADHFRPLPGDQMSHKDKLQLVEGGHFTPDVEQLIRGNTARLPHGDLEYTLRVFPNHHRALVTLTKMWERAGKSPQPTGLTRPVECYFERALRFQSNDNVARLLYASFLIKADRKPEAVAQLKAVEVAAGDNAFTHYNVGMVYADAGMMDNALVQAHRAMALGLGRQELRQRLIAAGSWKEPSATSGESAASTPAAQ